MTETHKRLSSADVDQVVAEIGRMFQEGRTEEALQTLRHLLTSMKAKNDFQARQIADLTRRLYGRRSEKRDPGPMLPFMEALEQVLKEQGVSPEEKALLEEREQSDQKSKHLPKPAPKPVGPHEHHRIPDNMPCEYVQKEAPEQDRFCRECKTPLKKTGTQVTNLMEFVPAQFKKVVISRARYECPHCDSDRLTAPSGQVIEGGLPGPSLLAHLAVMKYRDHLPLNRIRGIFARSGVDFSTSTLSNWVGAVALAFARVHECLMSAVMASYVVGTDDTGLRVLDDRHPGGVKRGVMWVYVGDDSFVAFQYTDNHRMEHPLLALSQRTGVVQSDGHAIYRHLARERQDIVRAGCMAHVRRKFEAAHQAGDVRALMVMDVIGLMYCVEAESSREGDTPSQRLLRRQAMTLPLMERFRKLLDRFEPAAPPKSPLGTAIRYAREEWPAIQVFLHDGHVPIDNNRVERAIRPVAVGRKNYLFAGSDQGARNAAILYSVLGTCALVGAEPVAYMTDVLTRIADGWPYSRIRELLPDAWVAQRRAQGKPSGLAGADPPPGSPDRSPKAAPLPSTGPP